jgi:DNA-binding beta-propeller fold protein YncE
MRSNAADRAGRVRAPDLPGCRVTEPDVSGPESRRRPACHPERMPCQRAIGRAVAVLGTTALALTLSGCGGGASADPPTGGDTRPGAVAVGAYPGRLAVGGGAVWVPLFLADAVARLDARTGEPLGAPIPVGRGPVSVALAAGSAWVVNMGDGTVTRLDARTGRVLGGPIAVGLEPTDVAAGADAVWVTAYGAGRLVSLDPATGRPVGPPIPVGRFPISVTVGAGVVWVVTAAESNDGGGRLVVIDPGTRMVERRIAVGLQPLGMAADERTLWVTEVFRDRVRRVNPVNGGFVGPPIPVGRDPQGIALGGGSAWVAGAVGDSLTRIDLATGRASATAIPVGRMPVAVAVGAGAVWVSEHRDGTVSRIPIEAAGR